MKKLLLATTILLSGCGAAPALVTTPAAAAATAGQINIACDSTLPQGPSLSKVGANYFLAYETNQRAARNIYLSTSEDSRHWSAPQKLFNGQAPALFNIGEKPAIAFVQGGSVNIAIQSEGSWKVSPASGLSNGINNPSVTTLQDGTVAIAYETLGGGVEVAESKDGIHFTGKTEVSGGYEPSVAQAEDGSLVVAYTDENGISEVTEKDAVWSEPESLTNDSSDIAPNLAKSGKEIVLTYCKKVNGLRAIAQVSGGEEKVILANGSQNLDPSVLFQGDEQLVALGIRKTDGGQGVYLVPLGKEGPYAGGR